MYSVIVKNDLLKDNYIEKLFDWNINYSIYGCGYKYQTDEVYLSNPHESARPNEILSNALPIFFIRTVFVPEALTNAESITVFCN